MKKNMTSGTTAARNMGEPYEMIISVEIRGTTWKNQDLSWSGMLKSTASMSLDTRFMTRPRGVVSKKAMGACRRRATMALWRTREAEMQPNAMAMEPNRVVNTERSYSRVKG